jgi:AmmeMemoRadiSam system protein B
LLAARRRRLEPRRLDLRNSGDTAGDRRSVVGYSAFAFLEPAGQEVA